jgi:hypothetical protein
MICQSRASMKVITISGPSGVIDTASPWNTMLAGASQVHWWQLLTRDHLPVTKYPPSRSTARPKGAMTPFTTVSSPPVSRARSCGNKEWRAPAIPLFNAHRAAEPSCRASSSMEARTVRPTIAPGGAPEFRRPTALNSVYSTFAVPPAGLEPAAYRLGHGDRASTEPVLVGEIVYPVALALPVPLECCSRHCTWLLLR